LAEITGDFDNFLISITGDYFNIENQLKYHGIRFMLVAFFPKRASIQQSAVSLGEKLKVLRSALQLDSKQCVLSKEIDLEVLDK
jgi:hypothetical protein